MDTQPESYVDIRQYLSILRTRKWTLVLLTVAGLIASLFMSSRQTPIYRAGGEFQVKPNFELSISSAENEGAIISSTAVADLVVRDLELKMSPQQLLGPLEVQTVSPTSNELFVSYTSVDPVFVRDATNSFMDSYITYRLHQIAESLASDRRQLEQKRDRQRARLANVITKIGAARRRGQDSRVAALETQRSVLATNLGFTQQELDSLEQVPARTAIGEILKPAVEPSGPASPDHSKNGALGAIAGLAAGIALAFVQERLDDRFKGRPDLERALQAPVLATVPRFPSRKGSRELPTTLDPTGAASEAYRTLRTALQFICSQREIKSVLVSSPSAHEGKTSTVANLGVALSRTGQRVALVSADLRRPQLEQHFDVKAAAGLTTWLLGEEDDLSKLVLQHPEIPGLSLLPAGKIPSNPAELLTSPRLRELISALERSVDLVLLDSPPVLPVADAAIIASLVGATILIVDAGHTKKSAAVHAKEQIERVGGVLIGAVLNGFDPSSTPYYYEPYYYTRYYKAEAATGSERPPSRTEEALAGEALVVEESGDVVTQPPA